MDSWAIVMIVATVFGSILVMMAIIGWVFVNVFGRGGRKHTGPEIEDESRIIQELYQGFMKMESRVESLETLLLEREREKERRS